MCKHILVKQPNALITSTRCEATLGTISGSSEDSRTVYGVLACVENLHMTKYLLWRCGLLRATRAAIPFGRD